jgi:hypothetical protein
MISLLGSSDWKTGSVVRSDDPWFPDDTGSR